MCNSKILQVKTHQFQGRMEAVSFFKSFKHQAFRGFDTEKRGKFRNSVLMKSKDLSWNIADKLRFSHR